MLKIYTLDNCGEWDRIVRSFSNYDVYYLSGYVKAFQLHGDGTPLLFYCEYGSVRGINVVMKRDIALDEHFTGRLPENTYFDFSTPYGYGGWLIENPWGENIALLFREYSEYCRCCNVVSEFVRFHPIVENYQYVKNFYNTVFLGETVAMDLSSKEVIFNNLKKENRKKIRKAEHLGVQVYCGHDEKLYQMFRILYREILQNHITISSLRFSSVFIVSYPKMRSFFTQ